MQVTAKFGMDGDACVIPPPLEGHFMDWARPSERIVLKNILFLTDFSEPSGAALPYAITIAREYGSTVHALHVLIPESYANPYPSLSSLTADAQDERIQADLQRLESSLTGVLHEVNVVRDAAIWPAFERALRDCKADLIVLGTRGRTGAEKMMLGSVAEEIFRRASVPALTIGPFVRRQIHNAARFHCVLLAADFSPESLSAVPYALSLAQESRARLILLHVIRREPETTTQPGSELSVASALHQLHELLPPDVEIWCRPDAVVEYGEPAARVLRTAKERGVDLIVLGVRDAAGHMAAATHEERTTAHKIVANARCPVLTVRGPLPN
jgi:nucleotide-binding universal stress UspA family protein